MVSPCLSPSMPQIFFIDVQYLTFTHLDLAFSVHQLCQFMHHPTSTHSEAAKHVLRYVKETLHHGIDFSPGSLTLSTFIDVDRTGDPCDRRSTTGLLVFLGSNLISQSSKKQTTVSQSSIDVEYCSLVTIATKISWLHVLFKEFQIFLSNVPVLQGDNVSTLALASNLAFHSRTKHIEVDFHYVCEKVICKDLYVRFVSSKYNSVDVLTKPLTAPLFHLLRSKPMVDSPLFHLRSDVKLDDPHDIVQHKTVRT